MFKVGDKVVIKDHPFFPDDYKIQTVEEQHIGQWYMNSWRLATQEELEAGHRIDLEELRDSDTSPNCKKYER